MYEFDSVSVSTYEASSLAAKLTERSGDGWDVVAIVPAGSEITAYLRRSTAESSTSTGSLESDVGATTVGQPRRRARRLGEGTGFGGGTVVERLGRPAQQLVERRRATPAGGTTRGPPPTRPHLRRRQRRRPCPPVGTPTRPDATSCATGTGRRGPSTCPAPASSTRIRPSRDRLPGPSRRVTVAVGPAMMRATSLGHAGILIESDHGSIVCDPWFVPAFSRRGSPSRATTSSATTCWPASRRRLPVRLAPARRPPRRAVAAPAPAARHHRARAGVPDPRARAPAALARLHRAHPHRRRRGAPARRAHRRDPRRDVDHRWAGRRLGARRDRR